MLAYFNTPFPRFKEKNMTKKERGASDTLSQCNGYKQNNRREINSVYTPIHVRLDK